MKNFLFNLISIYIIFSIFTLNGVFADGENVDPWNAPNFSTRDEQTVIGATIGLIAIYILGITGKGPLAPSLQRTKHNPNPMNTREEPYTADTHWRNKETSYGNPSIPEGKSPKPKPKRPSKIKNKKKVQKRKIPKRVPSPRNEPESPFKGGEQNLEKDGINQDETGAALGSHG